MLFLLIVIWWMVHEPKFVAGLVFTLSSSRVLLGTTGMLKLKCDVTETDASVIYNIQIRRETDPGSNYTWETLAEIEAGLSESPDLNKDIVNDKDFVAGGFFDKATPTNTYLVLDMNKEKLTKSDTRVYSCEMTYKSNITGSVASAKRNANLLIVDKNDENDEDDDHYGTLSDSMECVEYVNKSTLVIVGVVLGLTNIATIVVCACVVIVVRRKAISGRSDDKIQHQTEEEFVMFHKDNTIPETVVIFET